MRNFLDTSFSLAIELFTNALMNKLRDIFLKCTDSWEKNIPVSLRVDFEILNLKIVYIVLILVG